MIVDINLSYEINQKYSLRRSTLSKANLDLYNLKVSPDGSRVLFGMTSICDISDIDRMIFSLEKLRDAKEEIVEELIKEVLKND